MTGLAAAVLTLGVIQVTPMAAGDKPVVQPPEGHPLDEIVSGYNFRVPETQAVQDDDFENPAFLWTEQAEELWEEADGEAGKACAECHDGVESLKSVGTTYPIFHEPTGKADQSGAAHQSLPHREHGS